MVMPVTNVWIESGAVRIRPAAPHFFVNGKPQKKSVRREIRTRDQLLNRCVHYHCATSVFIDLF